MEEHFDVVVVGSGFGASASACRLAQAGRSVLVLERGRSYPPGSFPRSPRGVAANIWDPSSGLYGMFDIWAFRGIESVVSSGLGGGSLIYANVMLRKDPAWFVDDAPDRPPRPWPLAAGTARSDCGPAAPRQPSRSVRPAFGSRTAVPRSISVCGLRPGAVMSPATLSSRGQPRPRAWTCMCS